MDPGPTNPAVAEPNAIDGGRPRASASTFKLPGLRWWMIALVMLGGVLNYLTRNTLSVQPIVGYVLDVVGLRIGLAICVTAWAVINMMHGLAGSWRGFRGLGWCNHQGQ